MVEQTKKPTKNIGQLTQQMSSKGDEKVSNTDTPVPKHIREEVESALTKANSEVFFEKYETMINMFDKVLKTCEENMVHQLSTGDENATVTVPNTFYFLAQYWWIHEMAKIYYKREQINLKIKQKYGVKVVEEVLRLKKETDSEALSNILGKVPKFQAEYALNMIQQAEQQAQAARAAQQRSKRQK